VKIKIFIILNKISVILTKLFVKANLTWFLAIIFYLNLRKMDNIKTNVVKKKVIILSKSGGIEDINSAFSNNQALDNEILFYELPRNLIKEVFKYFMSESKYADYYTIDYNDEIIEKKKNYKNFIHRLFKNLDSFFSFDALISFNLFYFAENDLPEPLQWLGKKNLVLHKESVNSVEESVINLKTYSTMNKKFLGDKVAVYCENEKKILIDSNVLKLNQVEVIGCARSDYSFKLRSQKPSHNQIVYFMIENNRSASEKMLTGKLVDWSKLIKTTNSYIIEMAEQNPDLNFVFKGKKNVHSRNDLPKELPKNCTFLNSNPGHKFLKDANVVIAFNSTILFEAILANRNIIIPIFGEDISKVENLIYKSPNFFITNKIDFFKKIREFVSLKYQNKPLSYEEKSCVEFYLGNSDGMSGKRLQSFLNNNTL